MFGHQPTQMLHVYDYFTYQYDLVQNGHMHEEI